MQDGWWTNMAEEHEHTEVTHLFHVRVPYHMDPREIMFEDNPRPMSFDDLQGYTEEEIRIVMRSVVLLLEKFPHRNLNDALYTAVIWLRG